MTKQSKKKNKNKTNNIIIIINNYFTHQTEETGDIQATWVVQYLHNWGIILTTFF